MDIVDLKEFYASRLGLSTRKLISGRLLPRIGGLSGVTVLGIGYALPYLEDSVSDRNSRIAFMMARRGVIQWPADGPVASALVDEYDLPLLESAIDIVLAVHALELSESPAEMLNEAWRVLAPQGRLLLVVPNRRGIWARFDNSPFGHGQPFSRPQLSTLLRESQFSVVSWSHALFFPPLDNAIALSAASAMENVGTRLMPGVSGVVIIEAVKQVYAIAGGKRIRRPSPRFRPALSPMPSQRCNSLE
jgi:SAM-dependent methyltransferase